MNIILLGPPGCGKGTQAQAIVEQYNMEHISTGNIFRSQIKQGTDLGKQAKTLMDQGKLVPDDITNAMVRKTLESIESGYLLDGYPRTIPQAQALGQMTKDLDKPLDYVINMQVSDEEIVQRMSGRRYAPSTGATYHVQFNPPPEGVQVIQRDDDKEETVRERLKVYRDQTEPLIKYYGDMVINVNGEQPIDKVTKDILSYLS